MKSLTIILMALITFSSYAETVKCDFFKIQKDGNSTQVDSLILGEVAPGQYLIESGREIEDMKGMFVNVQLNSGSLNVAILLGSAVRSVATEILAEVAGSSKGLSFSSRKEKITFVCSPTK